MIRAGRFGRILAMALALGAASNARAGEGQAWSVSKSSGEVWMTTTGAEQVSLSQQNVLKPGDTIRAGHNGRDAGARRGNNSGLAELGGRPAGRYRETGSGGV
jgi:hypothetical protein